MNRTGQILLCLCLRDFERHQKHNLFCLIILSLYNAYDNASAATRTPVMITEFLDAANFVVILIVLYLVMKIYKIVTITQTTGNETTFLGNARANPRVLQPARDVIQHFPHAEGTGMWNGRIIGRTPAVTRLPRHHDERL